jgi:iron-sulfur cluster repair protein YtfE (RIC family)
MPMIPAMPSRVDRHRTASHAFAEGTVRAVMSVDHDRLHGLFDSAFASRDAARFAEAREAFASFALGLRRHSDFEEQVLLPEFERRTGFAGEHGPSITMRAEHRAIAAILAVIEREIADPEAPVELSRLALRSILHDHDLKEEQIIYPALDRLLDDTERAAVVARAKGWGRE